MTSNRTTQIDGERIGVLEELLNERFSCRAFLPKPVARATIERVLKVAQRTASWCNVPIVLQWPTLGAEAQVMSMNWATSISPLASIRRACQTTVPEPASPPP